MSNGLLKPKRQMSEKQMEALKRGREKRHQQMRTTVQEVEALTESYSNEPQIVEPQIVEPQIVNDDVDDELEDKKMMKEIKKKEHEMKMKELELKMSRMEHDYSIPKKEEPKEEPKFVFRDPRQRIFI